MINLILLPCIVALAIGQHIPTHHHKSFKSSPNVDSPFKSATSDKLLAKPSIFNSAFSKPSGPYGGKYSASSHHPSEAYTGPATFSPGSGQYSSNYGGPVKHYESSYSSGPHYKSSAYSGSAHYESKPVHYESGYESGGGKPYAGHAYYNTHFNAAPGGPVKTIKNPANYLSSPSYEKVVQVNEFPQIGHNGMPLETAEVAAAKAAHFEAHAKALSRLRYRRSPHHHGHHAHGHGYGHAWSTQNHHAHFGPHHEVHVGGGHHHHRRRRDVHHHGPAWSTQNHHAHWGPHHKVHVGGGHHHGHHLHKRDTHDGEYHGSGASSSINSNSFFDESKQIKVAAGYSPDHLVPHETAEVQLAKQAHFQAHDKVNKQHGYYQKPVAAGSNYQQKSYKGIPSGARYQSEAFESEYY